MFLALNAYIMKNAINKGKNTLYASVSTNPAVVRDKNVVTVENDKLPRNANKLFEYNFIIRNKGIIANIENSTGKK